MVHADTSRSGYLLASSIRIALCLLTLTFTIRQFHDAPNPSLILGSIVAYLAYSLVLLVESWRKGSAPAFFRRFGVWIDGIFCSGLTAVSGGWNSPFNFLFFFAIIDAATSQRFWRGLQTITALTLTFGVISVATMNSVPSDRPPITISDIVTTLPVLFILGVIVAFRSETRRDLKNRLSLLQQITAVASPMIGLERSIGVTLGLLQSHFEAKDCILVTKDEATKEFAFFRAHTEPLADPDAEAELPEDGFLRRLLSLSPYHAVMFDDRTRLFRKTRLLTVCADSLEEARSKSDEQTCVILSEMLDAPQFLSVPVRTGRNCSGRIYVINSVRGRSFGPSDIGLADQVARLLAPLIENARLIDRISSNAAEEERKRIARDIHDSIIQPHLGIKLGLESISSLLEDEQGLAGAQPIVMERLRNLHALTDATVENLRGLVHGLADSASSGNTLLPSVKRFADKFAGATGIAVHVVANGDMRFADKLAPDVFQLAVEGLSNIRKHTSSPKAVIELNASENLLNLKISNEGMGGEFFRPRSLSERASALGGTLDVLNDDGRCTVDISIPI